MSTKTLRALPVVVLLAISLLGFGLANPGTARAWLAYGPLYQYPSEGGTWEYGFWNARVWSNYYHPSVCHGSTVGYNGSRQRSVNTAPGYYSQASIGAYQSPGAYDEYFYRPYC